MVANYDLMPTLLRYLGLTDKIPTTPLPPGRSYDPVLRGRRIDWDNTVFFEFENVRAIRTDTWKYIERIGGGPNELFDLKADPGERKNLCDTPEKLEIRESLGNRLHTFFDRHAVPKWDLWKGGDAKGELTLGKRPYQYAPSP